MTKLFALGFGFLKLGKIGGTVITMLVSLAVYGQLFGWRYALGFILMLLIHEAGHYFAAREKGLDVSLPTFIPFVGAWIELKDQPMDVRTESYVAVAGPVAGTVAATAVYFWGRETQSGLLLAIAYSGLFLNFFNLIPLPPLDGGRITAILSPRVWLLGVPLLIGLVIYHPSALLVLIGIAAIPSVIKAWSYDPTAPENVRYYDVPRGLRAEYAILYLGLLAYLAYMTEAVHQLLPGRG
jgi:Zn-dependent protease